MDTKAKRDWGMILSGVLVVIAGFLVIVWPGLSLITLAIVAGVMFVVAGIFSLINYFRFRDSAGLSGWNLVTSIFDIILGVMFLIWPFAGALAIAWMAGAFVVAYGVMAIATAIKMRAPGSGWGWMLANGVIGVLCGLLFFFMPELFAFYIGFLLIMRGITLVVFGFTAPNALPEDII